MGWKRVAGSVAVVAAAAMSASCGSGNASTEDDVPSVSPSTTTTRTPRVVDDSGRPQITFDPCLDIPDDLLVELGYDPRSEEPTEYPMGSYSFMSCRYGGTLHIPGVLRRYTLGILSGNVSLDEELSKNRDVATQTTINGRRALLELDPGSKNTCTIVLEAPFGIVFFSRTYNADHPNEVPQEDWCAGLPETVTVIEPLVSKR